MVKNCIEGLDVGSRKKIDGKIVKRRLMKG